MPVTWRWPRHEQLHQCWCDTCQAGGLQVSGSAGQIDPLVPTMPAGPHLVQVIPLKPVQMCLGSLMARQDDRPSASRSPLMTSAKSPSRTNLVILSKTIMEGLLFLAQSFIYKSHPAYSSWFHYPLDVYRAPFLNICAIILLGTRVRLSR